jgi:hypothetical protein
MHWLVEVSRVGDTVPSERYCIDARRWQSALQEARRMRGDAGALPKLTIELTDSGYRAIDPEIKVRYFVSEAPPSMPLTDGARAILSTHPPPVESSAAAATANARTANAARGKAPTVPPPATSGTGAPVAAVQGTSGTAAVAASSLPVASRAPAAASSSAAAPAPAASPAAARTAVSSVPPVAPGTATPVPNAESFAARTSWPPVEAKPSDAPAEGAGSSPPPATAPPPAATTTSAPPPSAQVIRQREEKPSATSPIAYRELALAVRAGVSRGEVEALLMTRLDEVRSAMPADARRFVQLAVFDHVFVKRPVRPPLGTLVWKDWRGEPSLSFPGFGEQAEAAPPSSVSSARMPSWSASMMTSIAPRPGSLAPVPNASSPPGAVSNVPLAASAPPTPAMSAVPTAPVPPAPSNVPVATATSAIPTVPAPPGSLPTARTQTMPVARPGSLTPARVVSVGPSKPPPVEPAPAPASSNDDAVPPSNNPPLPLTTLRSREPVTVEAAHAPEQSPSEATKTAEAAPEIVHASDVAAAPEPASFRRSDPALGRRSDPALRRSDPPSRRSDPAMGRARRRAQGEDLISELFERMHELAFMPDITSGADYVLNVLFEFIPCEGMLVHVFDLGRREFVVVRAHGPSTRDALLYRTPDTDPLVVDVMRRRSIVMNGLAPRHSGAFERLGVQAKQVLSGAARQGGRYLGLIELANPLGGAPFHEGEKNALEYVCEQFADFVASRPLVLDEDIVLRA